MKRHNDAEVMRLQKAISHCGVMSRRAAEREIVAGRVLVNGRIAQLGDSVNLKKDRVQLDGNKVNLAPLAQGAYIMLNKPRGYVCSSKDELDRRLALDLLHGIKERVYSVGRLDKDSEGLLIFTNDGDFANLLMHPKNQIVKQYKVTVSPRIDDEKRTKLEAGFVLDGEKMWLEKVEVLQSYTDRTVLLVALTQGKNRQIRRMCASMGLYVRRLKRVDVGTLKLGGLKTGEFRHLEPKEVAALKGCGKT